MSKRLTRIFAPAIPNSLSSIIQQEIHVVLRSGNTFFGCLESFNDNILIIKDLRDHTHEIKVGDVEEVILDHQGTSPVLPA